MYEAYPSLLFDRRDNGVLVITINRPDRLNATDNVLHWELANVWRDVERDDATKVVVITGAGSAFSAGGDLDMVEGQVQNFTKVAAIMKEAADIVYNIADCEKVIISAINGVAVGAGLAVALMADISIMAEDARFTDGHTRLGVVPGDHAALIWPLLCGLSKAKYYLLTSDFLDGREADRLGLVSRSVPADALLETAFDVADRLATGPQHALRWTKRSLNLWLKQAYPVFEASLAMEMLSFMSDDVAEGVSALKEKRRPSFPSAE